MPRIVIHLIACAALLIGVPAQSAVAQLAPRPADEWIALLDAPARVASLQIDTIISRLRLRPGDVVADLGAGSGVFSGPLARAVGGTGKVYAVDVDQALVDHVSAKAKAQNTPNVRAILGKFEDPALPTADVDVAFMHDVLHHVRDRTGYLTQVVRYLKPGGRIAIVELDPLKGSHRDDPTLQVSKDQLRKWMSDLGFSQVDAFELSPEKWYASYARSQERN